MGTGSHANRGAGVRVDRIEHHFGDLWALDELDLTVEPGELVAVLGPSGCGKSTLLGIVAGLTRPSRGRVLVDGTPLDGPNLAAGVVFQKDLLLDWRTALDNVLLQAELRGLARADHRDRAADLLRMVGLGDFLHTRPRGMSGGMRQRVALCRALLHEPRLLLLDEPFGALDALTREQLNVDVSRLVAEAGTTVVLVTHSIEEAAFLADRVLVMSPRPGRIVADLPVEVERPRRQFPHGASPFAPVIEEARRLVHAPPVPSAAGPTGAPA